MITLKKLPAMTEHAAALLESVNFGPQWPLIVDDVNNGRAELLQVENDTYAITRCEPGSSELVICALAGEGARELMDAAIKVARANQLTSIRFHTQRKGLHRLLSEFGPVECERVYRVQVHGGCSLNG